MTRRASDDDLTTIGLLLETHAGLTRELGRRLDRDAGLSVQWFEVLLRLARSPGQRLRMTDLAAQTTLTPSGLTRAVDRLEEAGLVAREACATDRRSAYAVLTEEGRARMDCAVPAHLTHVGEVVREVLSDDEMQTLAVILRKLRDALNPGAAATTECEELLAPEA